LAVDLGDTIRRSLSPIRSGTPAPHRDRGACANCHKILDSIFSGHENINAENPSYRGKLGGRVKPVRALNSSNRIHASGTLFKLSSSATVYRLENGQKRAFPSGSIYLSHYQSWSYIAIISSSRLDDYPNGPNMLFRQGTLIRASGKATVYQIEFPSSIKRGIPSMAMLSALGYSFNDVIVTTQSIANLHPAGSVINDPNVHVAGALVKKAGSAAVNVLEDGTPKDSRRPIPSMALFNRYFKWNEVATIDQSEHDWYNAGSTYLYQDGTLLKGSGATVYQIGYGEKHAFTSMAAFTSRGFNWNQIVSVSNSELNNYTTGEPLN